MLFPQEARSGEATYIAAQAAVDASKANVRRFEQLQNYEKIIAPSMVITARNTDIGDLIMRFGIDNPRELFHLATTGRLGVYVAVPEFMRTRFIMVIKRP